MKKSQKIATGIAVGAAVAALFMIPKTRKMLSKSASNLSSSLKGLLHKAENHVAANA